MPQGIVTSARAAEAIPAGMSQLDWVLGAMDSVSSMLVLGSGLLIFGGACYLVATKRRPAVLAAFLVLLPLPVLISLGGWIKGTIASLTVVAASPNLNLSTEEIAGGVAQSLLVVLAAMLVSAPSYFVLGIGLLVRTLRPPTDAGAFARLQPQRPKPVLSSEGQLPAIS